MSTEPYFSRCGLEINAEMDMGSYLLENGVCCYSGLGDGYSTGDCYWEVIKGYDYTHDGIRELQFDAVCYIPGSSIPYYEQQYITNTNSELYDAYTGMWLTTATTYDNSERGDNYYVHTVDWNGSSYMIEFAYSNDWQYYVGDWAMVFTKSYVVYMPEDYDASSWLPNRGRTITGTPPSVCSSTAFPPRVSSRSLTRLIRTPACISASAAEVRANE